MEGEGDKTPLNAEQKEEITAATSAQECHAEEPMDSDEKSLSERANKRKYDPAPCIRRDGTDMGPTQEKKRNVEPPGLDHQISFRNTDQSHTIGNTETKQHGNAMEQKISVAGTIDEEQPTDVSEMSTVKKTLKEGTSLVEIRSTEQISTPVVVVVDETEEINQAVVEEMTDTGTMIQEIRSNEQISTPVVVVVDETEEINQAVVQEMTDTGTMIQEIRSTEQISTPVVVVVDETEEINQAVVEEMTDTGTMTENVERSFSSEEKTSVDDQSNFVEGDKRGETGSTAIDCVGQKSNENVMPSNELDFPYVKENISEVSENANSDQISSSGTEDESQQPTLVFENTSVEEKTLVGIGNEFSIYDTGHIVYGCTGQTSNRAQQLPEGSDTNPENVVTLESVETGQLSAVLRGMDNYLESSEDECSSNESCSIIQGDSGHADRVISNLDPCTGGAETIFNSGVSISLGFDEVHDEFDDILDELMVAGNLDDKQVTQSQQSSRTEDDASDEDAVVGEGTKVDVLKGSQESAAREEPKGDLNKKDDKGHGSGYLRKRKADEPSETRKTKKQSQTNYASSDDEKTDDEKTFTIVFHAMLSNKFKLDDYTQFEIRGEKPVFNGWGKSGKQVIPERNDDKQLLLQCELKVPLKHASSKCAYKYVLLDKNNKATFEYLVEFSHWSGPVNRCLVEDEFVRENQTLHKYDGFIHPEPPLLSLDRLYLSDFPINDRKTFFQTFFPRWSGFFTASFNPEIQPVEALLKLDCLVENISSVWTSTSGQGPYCNHINPRKLNLWKLFDEILMPKVLNNLDVLKSQTEDVNAKVDAVVSSVVIAYVFIKYRVSLEFGRYEVLLKCFKLPPNKEICSGFMNIINKFDDNILSSFTKIILQFYQTSSSHKRLVLSWVPALPLLHFLRRESEPFQDVLCEKHVDDKNWKWWGWDGLPYRDIQRHIKESQLETCNKLVSSLKEIFDMDRLLKRTFLLLCPVEMFRDLLRKGIFSCLELCVTMRKLLPETKKFSSSYPVKFVEELALFFKEIKQTLSSMSPEQFPKERLEDTLVLLNNLVELVRIVKQHLKINQVQVLCRLVECLITVIVLQKKEIDVQDKSVVENENSQDEENLTSFTLKEIPNEMSGLLRKQRDFVDDFINKKVIASMKNTSKWDQEFLAWNELLSLSAPKIFYEPWCKKIMNIFQNKIRKASPLGQIELFCQSDKQGYDSNIATCLSDIAFEAVEKVVRNGRNEEDAFNLLTRSHSKNGIKLLREMLHKSWPAALKEGSKSDEKEKHEILLKHLLSWPTWPGFLKFFGTCSNSKEDSTKDVDCTVMVTRAESCLWNVINSVKDGTVTVATLQFLKQNSEQYFKLGDIYQKNQNSARSVQPDFLQRNHELDVFLKLGSQLKCFIGFTYNFPSVDLELRTLREKINQDYNNLPIRDLCVQTSGTYEVTFFNLEKKFCNMVSRIAEIKSSQIFNELWQKHGKDLKKEVMTMEIMCDNLWKPICDELKAVNRQFLSGDMLLKDIDNYLKLFNMDYVALKTEFLLLSKFFSDNGTSNNDKVEQKLDARIERVKKYQKLFDARDASEAIEVLRKKMNLQGDFSAIKKLKEIISGNFQGNPFKSVSDKLLAAGKLFEKVTPPRRRCLMAFTKCFDLVAWLRKSIKDEQELKVFVDLAMISAGEEDMEIDRISCMHTSCLGFGSLIFGYKPTDGFDELMQLCEPVWQAVDANETIGEKLVVTQQNLSWLKQIKESHGSVALTTMVQVEAINSFGKYFIADSKTNKRLNNDDKLCVENLVCLVVPKDEIKNREEKIYSFEEIKDVQSKLMLIAGKAESGKEEVDQFNEVFEGILRVSDLFVQLCEVGEISYLKWKRNFQCSKIEGQRDEILRDIDETCEKMESELKKWKETVNNKRQECYFLNHFTMKQILNLRNDLAKACTGQVAVDKLPLQTFMLLETINKSINPLKLVDVLKTMIPGNLIYFTEDGLKDGQKYFENDTEGESILEENVEEEIDVTPPRKRRRANSIDTFTGAKETLESMSMDINTDDYLLAALQECGRRATKDELVAWVVSHENDDEETIMTSCEEAKKNPHLSDLVTEVFGPECQTTNDEEELPESTKTHERPKIVPNLEKPYVNNEEDTYLTLDVLAAVLQELSESESVHTQRTLPTILKKGEPNLLLVPKGEVFGCVLSLFMRTGDELLPTDEEVIVCDENTTAEEIELLWRRAVVDERGLLFCLVNADLLDFDVIQQAVRSLEMLTQGHSKYNLIVICSTENEDKSNMVTSLSQFRRPFPPITSMRGIQEYLRRQLSVSYATMVGDTKWEPAASVDMENLSVRVVQSSRAGMGKSLIVKHLAEQLTNLPNNKKLREGLVSSLSPTIPVHGISVDSDRVTRTLLSHAVERDVPVSRIFHLDMSQSVVKGLDNFLFKLVVLRSVKDHSGNVWRRKSTDMYVIEITTDKTFEALTVEGTLTGGNRNQNTRKRFATNKYSFVKFLPRTHCLTPRETLDNIQQNRKGDTGFDMEKFHSEEYQRTFQYLTQFDAGSNLDQFSFTYEPEVTGDPADALKIITRCCGIRDPSWAELNHFVNFLNVQLRDCEESVFCNTQLVGDLLQGFKTFAVRFMIEMSRDFATRSLSDNNLVVEGPSVSEQDDDLAPFQMRRRWEKSPHPYIFFNEDRMSMTFLGFLLNQNGDLLNPASSEVLVPKLVDPTLRGQLKHQGVDFDVNYEKRDRKASIKDLCSVMGIGYFHDPDPTYQLTTDNVEKILAIHMRFRCGIPVIIMGETGCGKTRLIRFMCELQAGPDGPKNLLLMKVHGGTSYAEIEKKVGEAEKLAFYNDKVKVDTVLFFDEANTTDAIDLIKEIMVDRRVNGRAINPELTRLHFIAACNPYRKHTEEMIKKLESAGLGYRVSEEKTDKLGSIPLRQLVYRVHPLPESMRPLVWDFGQLTHHTEELYTRQIVRRFMEPPTPNIASMSPATEPVHATLTNAAQGSCIAKLLSASQKYMRKQKNECSFVSLRDVERAMKVIMWFYSKSELIDEVIREEGNDRDEDSSEESSEDQDDDGNDEREQIEKPLSPIVRAVILGIGVCYYARLNDRDAYCQYIQGYFDRSCPLPGGSARMKKEIRRCQRGFLKDIQLGENIARNTALSENVFMMAICTELRIPLFVVGKPGSSKSLAKDVISTNMKAANSQSKLFKNLKQIHMQSYQCSPLSTPEGIVSTFRQCEKLQKDKDLTKFVSVVVLDEIGLAEDSPLMPLKTLHPLLEDGTATTEESGTASDHHRVGFIGLSNWALDPAKMNRGIMLSRGVPSEEELCDSARGICSGDEEILRRLEETIRKLCAGYFDLYEKQSKSKTLKDAQKDEFFGLRDFYSLVKMVHGFAKQAERGDQISELELEQSIRRNFSGLDDLDPVKIFSRQFPRLKRKVKFPSPECNPVKLIEDSLGKTEIEGESRYLLILTENYAALRLLQGQFCDHDPVIIFGSSFPKDQQYTQICRNINRIKVCMETGTMVVLLNLESLYESLYDALNQYYVYLDKQKYVDLGLGNHRVKCRVADKFKLIVVAEKDDVYKRFQIPLINRLEKHLVVMSTGLTEHQARLVKDLKEWVEDFSNAKHEHSSGQSLFKPGDCFVGYHSDTAAAVVVKIFDLGNDVPDEQILAQSKYALLQTASPDAIARLAATKLKHDADQLWTEYFENQKHGSLKDYLVHCLGNDKYGDTYGSLVQITTHSRLLSQANSQEIASAAGFRVPWSRCISLQEFHTEQQFTKTLEDFFVALGGAEGLLLVQCDNGEKNFNLIACCRYLVEDTRRRTVENFDKPVKSIHIVFIIQLPKIAGGCQHFVGFQGGKWQSVHIDELLESNEQLLQIEQLVNHSVSDLFHSVDSTKADDNEDMDVDENQDVSLPSGSEELPMDGIEEYDREHIDQPKVKPTLLLKNCLQAAAARIVCRKNDESAGVDRATKRIEILLEWLPDDDSQETELSKILVARIHKLLLERDDKCRHEDQRLWLQHEALCQGHLQETGTFRKALWQKLSSIVSPLFSEVIAYCDQNQNLDLLREGKEWKTGLWLKMIKTEVITPLAYDSFISPVSGRLRERARVLSSGAGSRFNGKFPFSWIIKDIVNDLLLQAGAADASKSLVSLRGVFRSSPLGNLLRPVFADEVVKNEATMNYMNDFLHMMYKPMVEGELQLIYDAVFKAAGQIHQLLYQDEEFELDIPLIHYSYSLIQARLVNFSELVHAFPDLVGKLLGLRARLDVGEMILDVAALECCLQQLEPKPEDLENTDNRLKWCNRVHCIRPIIQVMKTLISKPSQQQTKDSNSEARIHAQLLSDRSAHIFQNCRTAWIRLDVVRMFIEHTCPPEESSHPADTQNAFRLWKALGDNLDFSTVKTMSVIERFLKSCSDELSKNTPEVQNSFHKRCKSFFMELVSLYCFGEQLPNPDLVRKFISYVIKDENRTEDFTPFDGQGIDVSPVIRSYILQKLLSIKERKREVHGHLQEYFRRARSLAAQREHLIEVCVLCVQCMEDVETVKLLKAREAGENVQILLICSILERTLQTIHETGPLEVDCLQDIAGIRAALDVLSTYLRDDFVENFQRLDPFPKCLDAARHLCIHPSRNVVQLFLLKQLVRNDPNGIDAVKERCKRNELKWIMPPQAEEENRSPDTFIVHHKNYHTVREALAKAILTSNVDDLDAVIKDLPAQPPARCCYILLALFREITTTFSLANKEGKIPDRILKKLSHYIKGVQHLPNELKGLAKRLLTNFKNDQLFSQRPGQSGNNRRLIEVLVHFLIVMKCLPHSQLLQDLTNLAFNPALMLNVFIPTMPHDEDPELMLANTGQDQWYECPNGHRYVVIDCGKPTQKYLCPTCQAPIGGENHTPAPNNTVASRQDRSATGHILGRAGAQSQTLTPTRNLTPLACGVLRCLTHVAMLLGTEQNMQAVAAIIKPSVEDVVQFLKEHIQHDIRCIARSTGNSDEAAQLIHLVLAGIVNNFGQQPGCIDIIDNLITKDSRKVWEDAFMTTYLTPVLSDITRLLQDSVERMHGDERLGNNRLMRLIHELDVPSHDSITELSPMCPALWRYRKKITIEFVSLKFQEYSQGRDEPDRCEVLAEFLKKEHHLRALQYLPDIIKLQRLLFEKFHRCLDRNEAEEHTLDKFLKTTPQTKEQFNALVNSFKMAWKIVRSCLTQSGRYSISQEMCSLEVKNSTPISMFLPAWSGLGRCALALNNFLVTLHNDFIGRCKSLLNDESSQPEIRLTNVTKAHLVAYDPDKDFLPMIFAHCDYSLKVGEGTMIDFNWKCLEKQVVGRFIRGRPRISPLVELFVFSKDICGGEVFKALKKKIPQVELTRPVQDQILNELNQLTDVCDVLKSLHIAIGFLSSAGGDPLMSVHEYLHLGLKMPPGNALKSAKAEQFCQLQHVISLWMLLSLERARILLQRNQDPFDDVTDRVKSSLDKKQKFTLNSGLQKLNVDHFVRVLLEFILLYLKNAPEEQLHWPLSQYINAKLEEKGCDKIDDLEEHVPEDIQVKHAVDAWKVACKKSEDYHSRMQP